MTDPDCVFCKIVRGEIPCSKIYEDDQTIAFLDIAPFEKGHVLVVPKCHVPFITDLPCDHLMATITVARNIGQLLLKKLACDGFNLLQNNGACATQTVPHVHFHLIPRYDGRPIHWVSGRYASPAEMQSFQMLLHAES